MRTIIRIGVTVSVLTAVAFGALTGRADGSVEVWPAVRIYGATAEQVDLGRWAVGRFVAAGLEAPPAEIHFHTSLSACRGYFGRERLGRVDVCAPDAMTQRVLLHEMSHVWLDQNVSDTVRERFLVLRGLGSWNASSDPWELRGHEQGAEILSWSLSARIFTPLIPDNDPSALAAGFELLTGTRPRSG
jgi:hypothetical protein